MLVERGGAVSPPVMIAPIPSSHCVSNIIDEDIHPGLGNHLLPLEVQPRASDPSPPGYLLFTPSSPTPHTVQSGFSFISKSLYQDKEVTTLAYILKILCLLFFSQNKIEIIQEYTEQIIFARYIH